MATVGGVMSGSAAVRGTPGAEPAAFSFRCELSLAPLITFWTQLSAYHELGRGPIPGLVREKARDAPELAAVIDDLSLIEKHRPFVDLMMSALFPPAFWEQEYGAALFPFQLRAFYATPPFRRSLMNADGTRPTRVTDSLAIDQYPDWSPDGRQIVFRHDADIYTLDLTNGETTRLTTIGPLNQMAAWSPNGRQLAFMSTRDGYPSVFLMNADGSRQTNLTPKATGDADSDWVSRAPSWSRNGQQIFFMSSRPSTGLDTEIFAMLPNGTEVRRLTRSLGVDGNPRAR